MQSSLVQPGHSEFKSGFPYYIYTTGMCMRFFEILLDTGELVQAWIDPSRQYAAEGLEWRVKDTDEYIPTSCVQGFRCIDGDPAFPDPSPQGEP